MTFLALENRNDLPRVSYATALDVYVAMCFIFVLLTIVQFAIVHRFTKIGHGDLGIEQKRDTSQVSFDIIISFVKVVDYLTDIAK